MKIALTVLIVFMHQIMLCEVSHIPLISAQDLETEIKSNKLRQHPWNTKFLVVNVLSKPVSSDCRIPGSVNVPVHKLVTTFRSWSKDTHIVLYCAGLSCPLSKYAFDTLRKLGFTNVRVFDGGLRTWKGNNFPTIGLCKAGYLQG